MNKRPSEALREYIVQRGITPARLARAAGMSRADPIQRWLRGERGLHLGTFDRLCLALGWTFTPPQYDPDRTAVEIVTVRRPDGERYGIILPPEVPRPPRRPRRPRKDG